MRALVASARKLADALAPFVGARGDVLVLSPLEYAWESHEAYLTAHAREGIEALLVGMNPGPWGMGQTGVPFGDPGLVRAFLGVERAVGRPRVEHARFRVLGFASPRREVSGQRLWGGVRSCFGSPEAFFQRFFVANHCPLLFLKKDTGANVTPDKLPSSWLPRILRACDEHLVAAVRALAPARVVGVGAWTTKRVARALEPAGLSLPIGTVLHPSPASPAANRGWLEAARRQLAAQGCPWPEPSR
ncbi:single-stranded DNA-binding protein [bacterium]|nr:single-stranded DNA-binding protein [bacterium]